MSALLIDVITLAVIGIVTYSYSKKGFTYSVVQLAGTMFSWAICYFYSKPISQAIYIRYFRKGIMTAITENIDLFTDQSLEGFKNAIKEISSQLPSLLSSALNLEVSDKMYDTTMLSNLVDVEAMTSTIMKNIVDPVAIGVGSIIVFLVLFAVCSFAVTFACSVLRVVKYIPIVGSLDSMLGSVVGLVWGVLYILIGAVIIYFLIIATGDDLGVVNKDIINESFVFKYFYSIASEISQLKK